MVKSGAGASPVGDISCWETLLQSFFGTLPLELNNKRRNFLKVQNRSQRLN